MRQHLLRVVLLAEEAPVDGILDAATQRHEQGAIASVEITTASGDCATPVSAPNSRCKSTTLPK